MKVEIQDIHKHFGTVKANDGISFTLEAGKIYGLLGENGAGKSTLMKILSGYQGADSGHIILAENEVSFSSPAQALAAGVGMLYQDPLDFPPFNVVENFTLGVDNRLGLNIRKTREEITNLAEQYEFKVDLGSEISRLSLGERQQLELVRLLVRGAELLILDEPTTGISAGQKEQLFSSIRRMTHDEGKTVILVSHKLDEVQELCNYAYVLRQGKLVGGSEIPCSNQDLVTMMFGELPERSERQEPKLGDIMLRVEDLAISTYRLSIENINFEVQAGEVFGLAGLEGSGQDLVMKACAGLIQPDKGKIFVDGGDYTNYGYHRTQAGGVSFVGSGRLEEGLVAGLSLAEHMVLASPVKEFWVNWEAARDKTSTQIEAYQVVGQAQSNADQLSGGNQQRFMFSMLNEDIKLLLLEHPTRGLDVRSTNWIWEQLYTRCWDDTSIVFISADLDEVVERSDRIAVFSAGVMSKIVKSSETSVDELGHLIGGQHG